MLNEKSKSPEEIERQNEEALILKYQGKTKN